MPQERYHWGLCPGHLTSDEEWLSSNIYKGSTETIQSGMLFKPTSFLHFPVMQEQV